MSLVAFPNLRQSSEKHPDNLSNIFDAAAQHNSNVLVKTADSEMTAF